MQMFGPIQRRFRYQATYLPKRCWYERDPRPSMTLCDRGTTAAPLPSRTASGRYVEPSLFALMQASHTTGSAPGRVAGISAQEGRKRRRRDSPCPSPDHAWPRWPLRLRA